MAESTRAVTLCVPVYNGARFVEEALSSIRMQSFQDFKVLISVDSSTDESATICKSFLQDDRFEMFEQGERLGWVDYCNWLITQVSTPYFCIIPQDDVLDPSYIDRLINEAKIYPKAAVIYSDIRTFGSGPESIIVQRSIHGLPITRVLTFLVEHFAGCAFRGLVRSDVARDAGLLQNNPFDDFAEDTVWLMKLAQQGELIRIPEPLYLKRYHDGNTHSEWSMWDHDRLISAWTHHCLRLAEEALEADAPVTHQVILLHALIFRLLRSNPGLGTGAFKIIGKLPSEARQGMISTFLSHLGDLIGEDRLTSILLDSRILLPFSFTPQWQEAFDNLSDLSDVAQNELPEKLQRSIAARDLRIEELERVIEEKNKRALDWQQRLQDYEELLKERTAKNEALYSSTSWRLTLPIRKLSLLARRLLLWR